MYGYEELIGKSKEWRNRKRLEAIKAYGEYHHPNCLRKNIITKTRNNNI